MANTNREMLAIDMRLIARALREAADEITSSAEVIDGPGVSPAEIASISENVLDTMARLNQPLAQTLPRIAPRAKLTIAELEAIAARLGAK